MANKLYTGRYTTENQDDVTVFLIGMRVNKRRAVHKWLPVFAAMPGMIKELYANKEKLGFLSMENYFGLRTTLMISYWRSIDDLLDYSKAEKHLAGWKKFNQKARNTDAVGIYHETYNIAGGHYESIYRNMPLHGLGKAMRHHPVAAGSKNAEKRLKRK